MRGQWPREDFCAAVDFLSMQENVDPERIGTISICGWGGMAINAPYFVKDAYKKLKGDDKELMIIPGASRVAESKRFSHRKMNLDI